ncbi:hypothetical protein OG871_33985 [Kitasatospora sp. NBC_00374]|uniref:hypothetical protein n=1 Tax=Kitasatospora sp. NBC_00374 TaxID=2975964 RepID=UPI0030E2FE1A
MSTITCVRTPATAPGAVAAPAPPAQQSAPPAPAAPLPPVVASGRRARRPVHRGPVGTVVQAEWAKRTPWPTAPAAAVAGAAVWAAPLPPRLRCACPCAVSAGPAAPWAAAAPPR